MPASRDALRLICVENPYPMDAAAEISNCLFSSVRINAKSIAAAITKNVSGSLDCIQLITS